MNIKVRAFGGFRELLGRELTLSLPEKASVRRMLGELGKASPAFASEVLDAAGRLQPYARILKNGRDIRDINGLETVMEEGDEIALFPPLAGG